jgi:hypothetical protein
VQIFNAAADKTLRKNKRSAPRMRPVARPTPAPPAQKQAALPTKEPAVKKTPLADRTNQQIL